MSATQSTQKCRICTNQHSNLEFQVREMLHGTREEYTYVECSACGCLQLAELPDDLSVFYPDDYCCHKDYRKRSKNALRRFFDTWKVRMSLPRDGLTAQLLKLVSPELDYIPWSQYTGVDCDSRILDIGCGTGKLLMRMSLGGFRILHGIDPFISENIYVGNVRIDKVSIQEYIESQSEKYELVMMHHAFEHVPDPFETLLQAKQLMTDDGFLLIRIPVADSYSREHYGANWYSWDAPRHTYLHTMKSMEFLAQQTGFVIRDVKHDATFHQLRNSELYRQGVPGNRQSQELHRFTPDEIREFKVMTDKLNREQRGEQAAFFLQKAEVCGTAERAA